MARRKINKEQIRNIQQSKGSYHINIPIEIIRFLDGKKDKK